MKKKSLIIIGIVLVILIASLLFVVIGKNNESKNKVTDALKFKEEYESLNNEEVGSGFTYQELKINENNPFVYSDGKEIIELLENGTGLIYLGYPKCPWCRNAVNVLQHVNAGKIYYLNMMDQRDTYEVVDGVLTKAKEGTDEYYKLLELLDESLLDYEIDGTSIGEKRIYVPMVIGVKNGEIVGTHTDVVDLDEGQTAFDLLTNKQQSELKLIYDEIASKVNGTCGLQQDYGC